eukprot:TRINITY_DN37488_c0_g1_i1.p1 TRINITY_DN37488_c0_g1~~TRINITY_DN37488_c0_g1_i1.p1  ORF type:complete len:385 (+),score=132.49 TRINITY_DN37488_c0_g1_i1:87-1241(+)
MGGSSSTKKEQEAEPVAEAKYAEEKATPEAPSAALKQGLAAGTAAVVATHWKKQVEKEKEASGAAPSSEAAPPAPPPPASPETKPAAEGAAGDKKDKEKTKGKGRNKEGKEKGEGKGGKTKDGKGKGKGGKTFELPSGPTGGGAGFRLNVKSLTEETKQEDLKKMFEEHGTVLQAQIKTQDNGKSRGFGFVIMSTEEEGKKAIEAMNGKEVSGKTLVVVPAERRQVPEGTDAADGKGSKGNVAKGKGKDAGKGKGSFDALAQQQQAAAAAYVQQYQQYMYLMASYYQQQQAAAAGGAYPYSPPAGAASGEQQYEGSLKSLSTKKGYGFIVNSETFKLYERDVYVDKDVLPEGAQVADRFIFTVELNEKGHPRAKTCQFALPQNQ